LVNEALLLATCSVLIRQNFGILLGNPNTSPTQELKKKILLKLFDLDYFDFDLLIRTNYLIWITSDLLIGKHLVIR